MNTAIQLYSLATPNGQKVAIALEEMGVDYEAHTIDVSSGDHHSAEFVRINPNAKIPAIVDPIADDGAPLAIMESGAILLHLAEATGKFLPINPTKRSHTLQWLFWQVSAVGPMFSQYGHFCVHAPQGQDLSYAKQRYTDETLRLLTVLENQLEGKTFVIGDDLTIADFAILPWVVCLDNSYHASEALHLASYPNIQCWAANLMARPAVARGMKVCSLEEQIEC
ncbi:glutathione S-transferase N-terminal domain-containing protein [Vibrio sp.]|uniref:glutathione S-transferase N-terminal domain-containing protein n=1 Tax=Vibrio sp. TaxID=678 RepID=UPI003D0F5620